MGDQTQLSQPVDSAQATPPRAAGHIYTRFGDAGQTSLLGRVVVGKDDPRVQVYGTFDEATSALGMARASTRHDDICRNILFLQGELIGLMAELATPPGVASKQVPLSLDQVTHLECTIDSYEAEFIATHQFVRPGGSLASAALDLARTIVRRGERLLVELNRAEAVNPHLLRYVNRLSDLLYMMARIDEQREIKRIIEQTLRETRKEPTMSQIGPAGLTLSTCDRLIEAGMRRAAAIGVPMVVAVADDAGNLCEMRRMDGALVVSITLAPQKATTAATVRMPTHELARHAQPGAQFFGIDASLPGLTLVGGGLPLVQNGIVIGGVGASGGAAGQDIDVAQAMVDAL